MRDFKNLIRDTTTDNNPLGSWQHAKNIVKTKGINSVANEQGMDLSFVVPGDIIGEITTPKEVVVFHKNNEGIDEIGVVNLDNDTPTYSTIIKTNLLNFNYNCPIEGIFIYNFKKELLIAWVDGIFSNSNPPRALNTVTLPFEVNPDGTLVNPADFDLINMTSDKEEAEMTIDYTSTGEFGGFAVFVTYSYVFADDSKVGYFPISNLAKVGKEIDPIELLGFKVTLDNLDTSYSKLRLGLVVVSDEGSLAGYEGDIIDYTGTSITIDVNSLNNYTSIDPSELVLQAAVFNKANTITKQNKEVNIGNVVIENSNDIIKFQKYANMIELVPFEYKADKPNGEYYEQEGCLMPDEVYSIYIQLQLNNGNYTNAFHIPGRVAEGTEKDDITAQQITDYALDWTNGLTGIKQFHVFNNGYCRGVQAHESVNDFYPTEATDESANKFGYWENEEVYPNNDEYDSTVDYNNNPLSGEDLRNSPIRYHRMPSLYSMRQEFRSSTDDTLLNGNTVVQGMFPASGTTARRKLGIKVTNFDSIIPQEIKDKIQGYRLLHVKRDNNSYVAGNWIGIKRKDADDTRVVGDGAGNPPSNDGQEQYDMSYYIGETPMANYEKIRVIGNELFKFRPSIAPTFIDVNSIISIADPSQYDGITDVGGLPVTNLRRFSDCKSALQYVPANSPTNNTQYHPEGINMDLRNNFIPLDVYDDDMGDQDITGLSPKFQSLGINFTAFNFVLNVYSGFKSDNLAIIGVTKDLSNNIKFKGGDVYVTNKQDFYVRSTVYQREGGNAGTGLNWEIIRRSIRIKTDSLFCPINYTKLKIEEPASLDTLDTAVLAEQDYDFDVIEKASMHKINDINVVFTFDVDDNSQDSLPFIIYRGNKIGNETLDLSNLITFKSSNYYQMPNDKGEIIALRGIGRTLYIQMRFGLFVAVPKDKLDTGTDEAFLGTGDLFDRLPEEILGDEKGYIGSISRTSCKIIKGNYICQNVLTGQIFMVQGTQQKEISAYGNKNWFWDNWDNGLDYYYIDVNNKKRRIDNPYSSVGHLVGFDKQFNRLLFIKKYFRFKLEELPANWTFDGEFYRDDKGDIVDFYNTDYFENLSRTLSFSLEGQGEWVCEHDYSPNIIFNIINKLFSAKNQIRTTTFIYEHNSNNNVGHFYGEKFNSYVDVIFNSRVNDSKHYQSFTWQTVVKSLNTEAILKNVTIDAIMIYNNHQCSGIVQLTGNHYMLTRGIEGDWSFNKFRDLVIDSDLPIIEENGELNTTNINLNKNWFEKSNFISKFIVVRLIMFNNNANVIYINSLNSKAVISRR